MISTIHVPPERGCSNQNIACIVQFLYTICLKYVLVSTSIQSLNAIGSVAAKQSFGVEGGHRAII